LHYGFQSALNLLVYGETSPRLSTFCVFAVFWLFSFILFCVLQYANDLMAAGCGANPDLKRFETLGESQTTL
jgi:hypothetical protein